MTAVCDVFDSLLVLVLGVLARLWRGLAPLVRPPGEVVLPVLAVALAMYVVWLVAQLAAAYGGPAPGGVVVGAGAVAVLAALLAWAHAHRWWS